MTFTIGDGLKCDLDRLVDTRLLVQANSGGGKSWCLRRILEQTHGKVQHLVIDPEGEFASLREQFDYVHAAKSGADTAADPRAAALLAERLLELKVSAILDIYELKAHERVRFVRLFLEALVNAPKKLWHPALVVVDEAHVYCPQTGDAESAGAVKDLATRGRKRGFCAVLATQRLSKLHKDAAAECNNKLIGRTGLDVDMKRAADELGLTGRDDVQQLRALKPGEFFAFGPAFSVDGVSRVQVGDVTTTHPKAGGHRKFEAPPPTAAIKKLLPDLADLPAEAEQRERSMADLKAELAQTKRELTLARKEQPSAETKTIEKFVLKDGHVERFEKAIDRLGHIQKGQIDHLLKVYEPLTAACADILTAIRRTHVTVQPGRLPDRVAHPARRSGVDGRSHVARQDVSQASCDAGLRARQSPARPAGDGSIGKGERVILTAVAQYREGASREQLTILTGYKRSSRDTYLQRLQARGLVEQNGNGLHATDAGIDVLGPDFEPLPTGRALLAYWIDRLGGGEKAILEALTDGRREPAWIDRDAISDRTGYKRSSRDTYLQRLQARRLVETERGAVRAAAALFD